jgi:hypothetical protein
LSGEHESLATIQLNTRTWYAVLDLAEQHGWNPMGTVQPEWLAGVADWLGSALPQPVDLTPDGYTPEVSRMVLLEDALNLADALERAFLAYEPRGHNGFSLVERTEWDDWLGNGTRPAVGVILVLVDFLRAGAFRIERC